MNKRRVIGSILILIGAVCGLAISRIWIEGNILDKKLRFRTICQATVDALACHAHESEIKEAIDSIERLQIAKSGGVK